MFLSYIYPQLRHRRSSCASELRAVVRILGQLSKDAHTSLLHCFHVLLGPLGVSCSLELLRRQRLAIKEMLHKVSLCGRAPCQPTLYATYQGQELWRLRDLFLMCRLAVLPRKRQGIALGPSPSCYTGDLFQMLLPIPTLIVFVVCGCEARRNHEIWLTCGTCQRLTPETLALAVGILGFVSSGSNSWTKL